MLYYKQKSGVQAPWLDKSWFMMAAGDDVCVFDDDPQDLIASIKSNTLMEKKGKNGLGQVVKMIDVGEWYEFDFCSKK